MSEDRNDVSYLKQSAQEKVKAFMDCADLGSRIVEGPTIKAVADRIAELESPWIPVSERLPEESGRYLCCVVDRDEGLTDVLFVSFSGQKWVRLAYQEITHWMPLPPKP